MKNNKIEILEIIIWPIFMLMLSCILFQKIPPLNEINIKAYLFTIILFFLINILFDSIFKNRKLSKIIQIILLYVLIGISIVKFNYTNEPLFISDILFSNNISDITSLTNGSILKSIYNGFFLNIFIVIICIFACNIFLKDKLKEYSIKRKRISILIFILFVILNKSVNYKNFILNNIYDRNKQLNYEHNVNYIQYYTQESFIGGMYAQNLDSKYTKPINYNKKEIDKRLKNLKNNNKQIDNTNIIVIFSESFFDVNLLKDDITFDKEVTYNFNKLKEEGIFVNMLSPTYGGISSNVEFELLTGNSMNFLNNSSIPFMNLYNSNKTKNSLSLIKELNNNNYYTEVVFGKDYYKSEKVYKNLGVNKYIDLNNVNKKGLYTSDEYMIDKTIEKLQNKKKNKKLFYMNCTIQSHMPFMKEKYNKYDINIKDSKLNSDQSNVILSYAQGVYDADQSLIKLYEYIKNYDEKTIILFFGDHLPYLKNYITNENIFDSLSYFNTNDKLTNTYRKYNTQGLILANYDISDMKISKYVSPDLLLTSILNNLNITLNDYYIWLYNNSYELLSSTNFQLLQDNNGNIKWINETNDKQKEYMNIRENMQYRFMLDNK